MNRFTPAQGSTTAPSQGAPVAPPVLSIPVIAGAAAPASTTEAARVVEQAYQAVVAAQAAPHNPTAAANLANAVTALYGLTGSGKSSLADTAIEYCWEVFKMIALVYAADLGGYGTKRITLIRQGIARVWDPRNHVDSFATMEQMSLGAFPATLIGPEAPLHEREIGYVAKDALLLMPHRLRWQLICAEGHVAATFYDQATMSQVQVPCPTCHRPCSAADPSVKVTTALVRTAGFGRVGLRVYDSLTALNEWGLSALPQMSAAGLLPRNSEGGSVLASADAIREGGYTFGTGSKAQVGFMQNRTYQWLANIRSIPDQIVPAIATFMVESGKGDDESGGVPQYGPKIAGNARTSSVGGWVGNLLYVAYEPQSDQGASQMVRRVWLTTHVSPYDPRRIPYVAKHRGTPLGMPQYLEEGPTDEPWSKVSLKVFFDLLNKQVVAEQALLQQKYPDAPGFAGVEEEVVVKQMASPLLPVMPGVGGRFAPSGVAGMMAVGSMVPTPAALAPSGSGSGRFKPAAVEVAPPPTTAPAAVVSAPATAAPPASAPPVPVTAETAVVGGVVAGTANVVAALAQSAVAAMAATAPQGVPTRSRTPRPGVAPPQS